MRFAVLLKIACMAAPLLHMTVGITRTFFAFAAEISDVHGSEFIPIASYKVPSVLTV